MLRKPVQLTLESARRPTGRGGRRPGAGRPKGRTRVAHATRERFASRFPLHVTLRACDGVGSLRRHRALAVVKRALRTGGQGLGLRVIHFALLSNHLHLVVESSGADHLARGMQGLAVRLARGWNRELGRTGKIFAERFHARVLRTPREVRHVLAYVLLNGRRHAASRGERLAAFWVDPFSSGAWFDGWQQAIRADEPWLRRLCAEPSPTVPASVWLLTTGWRRWRLLAFDEVPGGATRSRKSRRGGHA